MKWTRSSWLSSLTHSMYGYNAIWMLNCSDLSLSFWDRKYPSIAASRSLLDICVQAQWCRLKLWWMKLEVMSFLLSRSSGEQRHHFLVPTYKPKALGREVIGAYIKSVPRYSLLKRGPADHSQTAVTPSMEVLFVIDSKQSCGERPQPSHLKPNPNVFICNLTYNTWNYDIISSCYHFFIIIFLQFYFWMLAPNMRYSYPASPKVHSCCWLALCFDEVHSHVLVHYQDRH